MYRITIEDLEHPEYGPQTLEYAHLVWKRNAPWTPPLGPVP